MFERSAYLSIQDQLICLGPAALGNGPLNLLCEPWPCGGTRRAGLRVNDAVHADRQLLHVGRGLVVSLAGAEVWNPRPIGDWDRLRLNLGLAALAEALPSSSFEQGLAPLLHAGGECLDDTSPVVLAARAAAQELARLVAKAVAGRPYEVDVEPIASLIGLGPGLTPSGDDFLGGALIALALLGQNALRASLWQVVRPLLPALSNDISSAHLAAAATGLGSCALHDLLDAVIAGQVEAIPGRVRAVASIGHTSGLDALAGAGTVLRAVAQTRRGVEPVERRPSTLHLK